jgi:hypothetical protein
VPAPLPGPGVHADEPTPALPLVYVGQAATPLTVDLTGKAALIQRGGATFDVKIQNAANAGAEFAIMFNNQGNNNIQILNQTDFVTIPAVSISQPQGEALAALTTNAAVQAQITAKADTAQALATQLRAAIQDDDERVGFRLQFAGGVAAYDQAEQFTAGKIGRTGVWATAAYRLEHPSVDLIALGRYLRNDEGTDQRAVDVGGRAVLLFQPWAASLEWVTRSASGDEGPGPDGHGPDANEIQKLRDLHARGLKGARPARKAAARPRGKTASRAGARRTPG